MAGKGLKVRGIAELKAGRAVLPEALKVKSAYAVHGPDEGCTAKVTTSSTGASRGSHAGAKAVRA